MISIRNKLNYQRENNPNWKGGISALDHLIRTNLKIVNGVLMCLLVMNLLVKNVGIIKAAI